MLYRSVVWLLSVSLIGIAIVTPVTAKDPAAAKEGDDDLAPYAGETLTVRGAKITREIVLQVIKGGLAEPRSNDPSRADRVVCRVENVTSNRACKHLWCSTNGELKRIREATLGRFGSIGEAIARGGAIDVTFTSIDPNRPDCINRAKLRRALADIPSPDTAFIYVGEDSLRRFADAYSHVRDIQAAADIRIRQANTPEHADRLQQRADAEMEKAIEAAELTVEEYNRLASRIEKNPNLREQVKTLLSKQE